jgi:hypothetical protein
MAGVMITIVVTLVMLGWFANKVTELRSRGRRISNNARATRRLIRGAREAQAERR